MGRKSAGSAPMAIGQGAWAEAVKTLTGVNYSDSHGRACNLKVWTPTPQVFSCEEGALSWAFRTLALGYMPDRSTRASVPAPQPRGLTCAASRSVESVIEDIFEHRGGDLRRTRAGLSGAVEFEG